MFLRSLQWRLVFIFISITVVLISVMGVSLNNLVESEHYSLFKEEIEKGFKNIDIAAEPSAETLVAEFDTKRQAFYLFGINNEYKAYSIINYKSNEVIYPQDGQSQDILTRAIQSKNYLYAAAEGVGDKKKLISDGDRAYFDYARKMGDYIIYFTYMRDGWQPLIDNFNKMILLSMMIAVVVSLILGYILSKTITVPIVNIMQGAKKLASGDFDNTLEVRSEDEIGKLTNTFNNMAGELKNKIMEISSEKNKIETILNYLTDGVIAFSVDGRILHANPAALRILECNSLEEEFNEFTQLFSLDISLEEILYLQSFETKEVMVHTDHRYVQMYFAPFTGESKHIEGIIIVLHDITEQQKLENMRRDFVANVSHELRTPLTSIKSYAETLLAGALEDRPTSERFLGVIESEADRMTRLVKDLLQLTRLDNQQMQWNMRSIDFADIVRGVVEKVQLEAEAKKQVLQCFTIGEIPRIVADGDRIEQVVMNILINAIKYTPPDGQITLYIGHMYSEVYIKVVDTGIGIPAGDVNRIFERFYRVDKARSREMGGTGLGLAIAKEIVEAHHGQICVNSEWGKGTEVTVKLPVAGALQSSQDMAIEA